MTFRQAAVEIASMSCVDVEDVPVGFLPAAAVNLKRGWATQTADDSTDGVMEHVFDRAARPAAAGVGPASSPGRAAGFAPAVSARRFAPHGGRTAG